MPQYITGDYNHGNMIPSASQVAARVSTLHNGLRPVTIEIVAESFGLQASEIQSPLNQARRQRLLKFHHLYGWITLQR